MEPLSALLVAAAAVSVAYLVTSERARARARNWREAAGAVGLADVQETETLGIPSRLVGRAGGLRVQLEHCQRRRRESGTRITLAGLGHGPFGLSLRREGLGTAFEKAVGEREIEIGDRGFDDELFVRGQVALARALLDAETRGRLVSLLRGRMEIERHGPVEVEARLADDVLQVELPEKGFSPRTEALAEVLRVLLALARRLLAPPDVPARIAENLPREPEAGVRLQCLLTLVHEFPDHPATRTALLAARDDPEADVRVQAGIALGDEGRDVLLAAAVDEAAPDATTARAVAALAERLTSDEAKKILDDALRTRREMTARECLEALGRRHGLEAVPTLAKVLAVGTGALAEAAASALGATRLAAAEPPLVEALGRESPRVRAAAAQALGRVGGVSAVPALREAAERHPRHRDLTRAVRQAMAEIQAQVEGAEPGQLSLATADARAGQLSLADEGGAGGLSLAPEGSEEVEADRRRQRPGTIQGKT